MTNSKTAEELKELGNKAFAAKKFQEAIDYYTKAIALDKTNHIFFSNRSASYAGMEDNEKASSDAKECIRLNPEFIKGYYRLAVAQIGSGNYDAAVATIRQGLSMDANNSQLLKQMRVAKQAQKIAEAKQSSAVTATGTSHMDEASKRELLDLQQQFAETNRELQSVQVNLMKTQRESKSCDLTRSELTPLPAEAKCFRSVGKMYLSTSKEGAVAHLSEQISNCSKQEADMTQKMEYLQRRLKSQKLNIEELVAPASSE